jgi:hypothetical protein
MQFRQRKVARPPKELGRAIIGIHPPLESVEPKNCLIPCWNGLMAGMNLMWKKKVQVK